MRNTPAISPEKSSRNRHEGSSGFFASFSRVHQLPEWGNSLTASPFSVCEVRSFVVPKVRRRLLEVGPEVWQVAPFPFDISDHMTGRPLETEAAACILFHLH